MVFKKYLIGACMVQQKRKCRDKQELYIAEGSVGGRGTPIYSIHIGYEPQECIDGSGGVARPSINISMERRRGKRVREVATRSIYRDPSHDTPYKISIIASVLKGQKDSILFIDVKRLLGAVRLRSIDEGMELLSEALARCVERGRGYGCGKLDIDIDRDLADRKVRDLWRTLKKDIDRMLDRIMEI